MQFDGANGARGFEDVQRGYCFPFLYVRKGRVVLWYNGRVSGGNFVFFLNCVFCWIESRFFEIGFNSLHLHRKLLLNQSSISSR